MSAWMSVWLPCSSRLSLRGESERLSRQQKEEPWMQCQHAFTGWRGPRISDP